MRRARQRAAAALLTLLTQKTASRKGGRFFISGGIASCMLNQIAR